MKIKAKQGGAQDLRKTFLMAINGFTSLKDLSPLKSVGLHKLLGDRAGQWAMTVNGPWRICFRFKEGLGSNLRLTFIISATMFEPCHAR